MEFLFRLVATEQKCKSSATVSVIVMSPVFVNEYTLQGGAEKVVRWLIAYCPKTINT